SVIARRESDRLAAALLVHSGIEQAEQGRATRGLFTLLEAWRTLPPEDVEIRDAIRANLAAWGPELPALISQGTWEAPGPRGRWLIDGRGDSIVSIEDGIHRRWDGRTGELIGPPS